MVYREQISFHIDSKLKSTSLHVSCLHQALYSQYQEPTKGEIFLHYYFSTSLCVLAFSLCTLYINAMHILGEVILGIVIQRCRIEECKYSMSKSYFISFQPSFDENLETSNPCNIIIDPHEDSHDQQCSLHSHVSVRPFLLFQIKRKETNFIQTVD